MSDYDFRPGGSLKLKGGVAEGGIVKKKKKSKSKEKEKGKATEDERAKEPEKLVQEAKDEERRTVSPSGSSRVSSSNVNGDKKTPAERRFEETQRKRLAEKVAKLAHKSHKDRVHEFNSKLEALSEHHDIPKVGPG
ncbi:hypothetical protein CERSUDRAFT_110468 [Gelatoporia subvermispora B]|uniref:DUF1754-domain-containing protein n=1 Tax=Ceriporiopsis subvermispora (strain B) TaxID=914234 RepID=M2RSM1_CERS8|nr:hypothetical protein CERSUDRAFT_110468 [Gelatoporia subvermispora B]